MDPKVLAWLITLGIILSAPSTSNPSTIQITDLHQNPGLLTLDVGKTLVKIGKHQIYYIIDLQRCEPIFAKLEVILQGLQTFQNFTDLNKILESKFSNTRKMFLNLMPKHRNKRGLLNFLGTTIKQITGNLDNNDLIEISENIRKLELNNEILINENNEQARINRQIQDRMNRIIKQLEEDHDQVKKGIIQSRASSGITKAFSVLQDFLKVNMLLDNIGNHLKTIFETIQLAKLRIISKDILSPEELKIIFKQFEMQKLVVGSTDQLYQYLEISAFYNQTKIIFVVEVPIFDIPVYRTLLVEPLISRNRTLKTPYLSPGKPFQFNPRWLLFTPFKWNLSNLLIQRSTSLVGNQILNPQSPGCKANKQSKNYHLLWNPESNANRHLFD
ncbi:uncharacterized protein LOC129775176 [Toxorhynchites rutilus septentrionalis]|uniref:uncharacterized protein LOC129775176 n=1 Tax=Toxorhynchites rutilus septentrionalis TaxID=329112 RepID=UPI00247AC409|nr:uncharacterized protein LOC129775176 [Toxorhynchites rutilus septentrionalis]